jgi:hypothetical protein
MNIPMRWLDLPIVLLALLNSALLADEQPEPVSPPGSAGELFNPPASPLSPEQPTLPGTPRLTQADGLQQVPGVVYASPNAAGALDAPIWVGAKPEDRERRRLKGQSAQEWGFVESDFIWQAPEPGRDSPFERGEWKTEDMFAVPVTGPVYLFTGVEMGGQYSADQPVKMIGRTGVLWKMPLGEGTALEVRGGPTMKYNDATRLDKTHDQGSMEWEVKAKCPLIGPFNLEYLGEALPAMTPEDRAQLKQDLNVFIPVNGGKFKVGAKHRWEPGPVDTRTANGLMEVYMGLEIGR